MKRTLGIVFAFCTITAALPAFASDDAQMKWFSGDPDVLVWPDSDFNATARVQQAATGGLQWAGMCHTMMDGAFENPAAVDQFSSLQSKEVLPIAAVRWRQPEPSFDDVISLGVNPLLPLPSFRLQEVVDWTNASGGAAILADPGRKFERSFSAVKGFAAVEGFSNGSWNPECLPGGAWDKMLARGERVFIVGGAGQSARPVLGNTAVATYVLARANTPQEIAQSIRSGRVFVSERDVVRLTFLVDGKPPGSSVAAAGGTVEITLEVDAREPVDEVQVIGNVRDFKGDVTEDTITVLNTQQIKANKAAKTFKMELDRSTRYLRAIAIIHRGACRTMTNPVFVGPQPPESLPGDTWARTSALVEAALGNLDWGQPDNALATITQLLNDRNVGPATAEYMARYYGKKELDRIRPLLKAPLPPVRAFAAYVLMSQGEAELPSVLPLLNDQNAEPRIFAARMLARYAKPEHLELALNASRDQYAAVRYYGLAALARIPSKESVTKLRQAMFDRSASLAHMAEIQLILMLQIKPADARGFIDGFKAGKLEPSTIKQAVSRVELHEFVNAAMAEKIEQPRKAAKAKPADESGFNAEEAPVPGSVLPSYRTVAAQAAQSVKIDGVASDECWKTAEHASNFILENGTAPQFQATVRAAYDETELYLLIDNAEPFPAEVVKNVTDRDGQVWLDDAVDIYVYPAANHDVKRPMYYRFAVNAAGVKFDEQETRRHWDGVWQAATATHEAGWAAELAIPFSTLGATKPVKGETVWLVNFVRHRRVNPPEDSTFVSGDPRDVSKWAELRFK